MEKIYEKNDPTLTVNRNKTFSNFLEFLFILKMDMNCIVHEFMKVEKTENESAFIPFPKITRLNKAKNLFWRVSNTNFWYAKANYQEFRHYTRTLLNWMGGIGVGSVFASSFLFFLLFLLLFAELSSAELESIVSTRFLLRVFLFLLFAISLSSLHKIQWTKTE